MKKIKTGITLIVLGNVLYVTKDFASNVLPSSFGDFIQGLLSGLGLGVNVVGLILVFMFLAKEEKKIKEES